MPFYKPVVKEVINVVSIVYPLTGIETVVNRKDQKSIENHLLALYESNPNLRRGIYHIIILWTEGQDIMTDVWIFNESESWSSGPIVDVMNYKGMQEVLDIGVTAGDGLMMLGFEETFRRTRPSIMKYLSGPRPELPDVISNGQEFY